MGQLEQGRERQNRKPLFFLSSAHVFFITKDSSGVVRLLLPVLSFQACRELTRQTLYKEREEVAGSS